MLLSNVILPIISKAMKAECEGEVAFLSVKRWDRRNRADLSGVRDPLSRRSSGEALMGIEPCPPESAGWKVRELHHFATTPSVKISFYGWRSRCSCGFQHQTIGLQK